MDEELKNQILIHLKLPVKYYSFQEGSMIVMIGHYFYPIKSSKKKKKN